MGVIIGQIAGAMTGLALLALAALALWQARRVEALRARVAALELMVFADKLKGLRDGQA